MAAWRLRPAWSSPAPALPVARPEDEGGRPASLDGVLPAEIDREALLAEADRYMAGRYAWLGTSFLDPAPDWQRDPVSGRRAAVTFSGGLDIRDPGVVGDIKVVWELNRHHHLTVLALAHRLTGDSRYASEIVRQLRSWVDANPVMEGVNWSSPFELATRLFAWVWIERLLSGTAEHEALFGAGGLLWNAAYWHQRIVATRHSFGSSANNHLIGEWAGLYVASLAWPVFPESERWRTRARRGLERECRRQVHPDGLNREQAFGYHLLTLEFFLLAGRDADRAGEPLSDGYADVVRRMLAALPRLADARGHLPRWGDDDEGMAAQLRPRAARRAGWLLSAGRSWPGTSTSPAAMGEARPEGSDAFRSAGVYVLASQRGDPTEEVLCAADAGPLGYLSLAAHGHADALSFTLHVAGRPLIVDPGTFAYHADPRWRSYFRGTAAHNTLLVDGLDQSVPAGPFLWLRHARSRVLEWSTREGAPRRSAGAVTDSGADLLAEHNGYARLKGVGVHRRRWSLRGRRLVVEDRLEGTGRRQLEWRLHLHPACAVQLEAGTCLVEREGAALRIALDSCLEWRMVWGGERAGWYSQGFNQREPACTLVGSATAALPADVRTTVEVQPTAGASLTVHARPAEP